MVSGVYTLQLKLLLVDDDGCLLRALQRMLRRARPRWRVDSAVGGLEGIRALDRTRYDVVLTDLDMPSVDGMLVLQATRRKLPEAVRGVLSGATPERLAAAADAAHFVLRKPAMAPQVAHAVESAMVRHATQPPVDEQTG